MSYPLSALERLLQPRQGSLSPQLAEYLLTLDFSAEDHARYEELSLKAQDGALTPAEEAELNDLVTANDVLTLLQSKARVTLKQKSPAA